MTRTATSFVLGYHGCDKKVGLKAIRNGLSLKPSAQDYDWLGPEIYFWEGDSQRALEWAESKAKLGYYRDPFVIGAIIDLGNCLDLLVRDNLEILTVAYKSLRKISRMAGVRLPKNKDIKSVNKGDKLLRFRDCAVIRHLHSTIEDLSANPKGEGYIEPYDTVRGLFVEGRRAYSGGGFFSKTHTQIAVRQNSCIKGIFRPR